MTKAPSIDPDLLQKIQMLGLNRYETKTYVSLVQQGTSSVFQVSKNSGVPRARIYEILNALERKGNAFYTDDPVHVYLLENYIWHDILANRLVRDSSQDMDSWIVPERDKFFSI